MTDVARNIRDIRATLPDGVVMVAVSKFHPVDELRQAYDAGQRIFGESRQQELLQKIPQMPADTVWHFIGHLQTNKVRSLIGHVAMIESVDSERLLRLIDSESARAGVVTDVLLQVHVAREETKYGFAPDELLQYLRTGAYRELTSTRIRGVMGMATNTDDTRRVRADFDLIARTYHQARELAPELTAFDVISMGMTHDYLTAVAAGSTMVRIGTAIFGEREY